MGELNQATYVANAGIFLELNNKKVLVDGFCNSILPIYKNPPNTLKEKMILGKPPFHDIDILLFSHQHSDHFDAESTNAFLVHNKHTLVVSTKDVIQQLDHKNCNNGKDRFFIVNPSLYDTEEIILRGVTIQAFSMLHEGKEYQMVQNIGFFIEVGEKSVLHVGDAKPKKENYMHLNLIEKNIDLLIVPFPYVGVPTGRQIIEKYIQPQKIVAIHLPYKEFDDYDWIHITKKSYNRVQDNFIETIFFEEIGSTVIV